ncbi:NAD(P)H-dependent glycerol-3-phosphate dehydrogenase [Actinomarinicola tropica]|uniref:Glycerol-3-phosphate dehydrogenase [NAD(P)+] n=1 Tax=Actinomarinicola tropica TaxID=2789776 RepID=A0A5Q2RNH5_9ACTN|nr:NAD(P)H-dependent glycerol-3-phosphate dehydrogenase [Actinomarinicola tropica]QGG94745.1 NAD(P)H-dependent glycerol-3-phosphate dehydrogenase [Actinomarinicola tropica]
MEIRVAVVGAGSWGTTVAHLICAHAPTILWAREEAVAEQIDREHRNLRYLPDHPLHADLRATSSMAEAVGGADLVVMGVPSHGFRSTMEQVAEHLRPWVPVISLTKGLEQSTRLRMSQVVAEVAPGHPVGVLTGPNLAKEILAGHAAATVVAMADVSMAEALQPIFGADNLRVYTNTDVVGAEMGGALKNVIAIASGIADGIGASDNTRAAVITRGLAELTRLGVAMGGEPMTFAGLAGMGDLIATCISPQSRNRHVGEQLGRGRSLEDVVAEMDMVAEGVKAAPVAVELAEEHGVEMPIARSVASVCAGEQTAIEAYRSLLARSRRPEVYGLDPGGR